MIFLIPILVALAVYWVKVRPQKPYKGKILTVKQIVLILFLVEMGLIFLHILNKPINFG